MFFHALNTRVSLLKLIPGASAELLGVLLRQSDAVVLESFGVGGVPEYGGYFETIRDAAATGKTIVMTTQVPNEGSDLGVYMVGTR